MRLHFIGIAIIFSLNTGYTQSKNKTYTYTVDLTNVVNDKVYVELNLPALSKKEIIFYMPKVIPGTYAIADYGRYLSDFSAVDKQGNKLDFEKVEENAWKIKNAKKLNKISYWVDDSFDTPKEGPDIFWPAGTNIEADKNFILNNSGFFGYIEGEKERPFQINVIRAENFYGSTGLIPVTVGAPVASILLTKSSSDNNSKRVDVFRTSGYDELIDSPFMYSKPDTAMIRVANTQVLIGSYAPNKKVSARQIAESLREVLMAQKEYLGGTLPVDKYAFIFYFTDQPVTNYGALEHSYSSLYYMPEMTIDEMNQQLRDFAAHEFFHIVTPLNIHSEEIENFDFNNPKMSQHLWMYEGVVEYFASNVQVKYGLVSPEEYLGVLYEKVMTADQFRNDVPFTDISKYTLDRYHDQYYNVYQKGALIGLCLDLKLRALSGGKYGLRNLMLDLSKKFGKNRAFKDDELFNEITKITYPEIGEFFNSYVKGTEKLPLQQALHSVGVYYREEEKVEDYSMGISSSDLGLSEVEGKPKLVIASTAYQNEMGKALGLKEGDVLIGINGQTMPDLGPELGLFLQRQFLSLPERDSLSYTVLRKDGAGQSKEVLLKAPVKKVEITRRHVLYFDETTTPEQLALRDSWLKP